MPSQASSLTGNFDWFSKKTYRLISIQYTIQFVSSCWTDAQFTRNPCQLTNAISPQHANTALGLPSCGPPTMPPTKSLQKSYFGVKANLARSSCAWLPPIVSSTPSLSFSSSLLGTIRSSLPFNVDELIALVAAG
jgi:hypothetical protein